MPLCIKGLKQSYCSLPVRKLIANSLANVLGSIPSYFLRQAIHEVMIKDLAVSNTS
jgi:hypothetical protein